MPDIKDRKFYGCSEEVAVKKLALGGNVIKCLNTNSKGYITDSVDVRTVEKFNKVFKDFKRYAWAVD